MTESHEHLRWGYDDRGRLFLESGRHRVTVDPRTPYTCDLVGPVNCELTYAMAGNVRSRAPRWYDTDSEAKTMVLGYLKLRLASEVEAMRQHLIYDTATLRMLESVDPRAHFGRARRPERTTSGSWSKGGDE